MFLGKPGEFKKSSIFAVVHADALWADEPWQKKVASFICLRWAPNPDRLNVLAQECLRQHIFGELEDFGINLLELISLHHEREWDFSSLTKNDEIRCEAMETYTLYTLNQLRGSQSQPPLNLSLAERMPFFVTLVYPMLFKIPIISVRWFIHIHFTFAVASVRQSGHSQADDIVSYLYEVCFLQQKTALCLRRYLECAVDTIRLKGDAAIIKAESDAIMQADLIFCYLKATVEKAIALLAATHYIHGIDSKKNHKARVSVLREKLPKMVQEQNYFDFIMSHFSSESLSDLDSFRSGLLHKKGIADLQPHSYVKKNPEEAPFLKLFASMHEQHAKNSAALLAVLAILTDELVRLGGTPSGSEMDIMVRAMASPNLQSFIETHIASQLEEDLKEAEGTEF
jgi:hypothetical protein